MGILIITNHVKTINRKNHEQHILYDASFEPTGGLRESQARELRTMFELINFLEQLEEE